MSENSTIPSNAKIGDWHSGEELPEPLDQINTHISGLKIVCLVHGGITVGSCILRDGAVGTAKRGDWYIDGEITPSGSFPSVYAWADFEIVNPWSEYPWKLKFT